MSRPYSSFSRQILNALVDAEASLADLALRFGLLAKSIQSLIHPHAKLGIVSVRQVMRADGRKISLYHVPDPSRLPCGVSPAPTGRCNAVKGTRRYQARRPCMCCRKTFYSEGPHNRLCSGCRTKSTSPFDN